MNPDHPLRPLVRRMRLAGALVISGLLVEAITLLWSHHLAFVLFLGLGGLLIGAGVVVYLWSLLRLEPGGTRPRPSRET